ncbi:MAG: hypothetical protein AB7S69_13105 [Salinivirgaceae bacterium]
MQAPDFTQSLNRFSYAWNNPLIYTDPDGEWLLGFLLFLVVNSVLSGTVAGFGDDFKHGFDWEEAGRMAVYTFVGLGTLVLTVFTPGLNPLLQPLAILTVNNAMNNLDYIMGDDDWDLHAFFVGYDHGEDDWYNFGEKGTTWQQNLDFATEIVSLLSAIPDINESIPFKKLERVNKYGQNGCGKKWDWVYHGKQLPIHYNNGFLRNILYPVVYDQWTTFSFNRKMNDYEDTYGSYTWVYEQWKNSFNRKKNNYKDEY